MDLRVIALLIMAVTFFILWIIVILKGKDRKVSITYSLFVGNMTIWAFGLAMFYQSATPQWALLWAKVLYVAGGLIPASFLCFSFVFPYRKIAIREQLKLSLIFLPNLILFILFFFTPIIVKGVKILNGTREFIYGPGHILFDLQFDIVFLWAFWRFFKAYKRCTGIIKVRLRYILIGTLLGVILAGITNVIMPWLGNFELLWLGPPLTLTWLSCVVYAIVRYHLLDIRIIAVRTLTFSLVYTFVLGIPFGLVALGRHWLMEIFGEQWFWVPMLTLLVSATTGPFFYLYLRRRAEDIMLKDQRRYQKALSELSKSMSRIRNLDELINEVVHTVVDKVKVMFAAIYLKDDEYKTYRIKNSYSQRYHSRFQDDIAQEHTIVRLLCEQKTPLLSEEIGHLDKINSEASLAIPCFVEDDLLAFMILGAKPKNEMYTPDDLFIFETLSYSIALAIENCFFWEEIHNRQRNERIKEMDIYSYSLAHEIDNPVQVILGSMEVLKMQLDKAGIDQMQLEEIKSGVAYVNEAAMRVSNMVKAIEDFGKPVTGELGPLKIIDVIDSFGRLYFPQFKSHGVKYIKELTPEISTLYVYGEKPELMQILVIFANNALHAMQYSKQKEITLKVSLSKQNSIKLSFTDAGYGIKKEMLPVLFAPFTTSKASSEGTGMGLYNAKKIIQRHKGKIWAESEGEGRGASFFIELPIAKDIKEKEFKKTKRPKSIF